MLKVKNSKVCLECDGIWTGSESCPHCGSESWIWLQRWIRPMARGWRPGVLPGEQVCRC
jgi:hypothetical protein